VAAVAANVFVVVVVRSCLELLVECYTALFAASGVRG
jgi:hypothetical protein